ncbi:MAG: GGDEF domain-containing protein, partial [Sphingomonas sp.]
MQTATTLFALSFLQRDEITEILASAGAGAGWQAVVAGDADGLESRFLASGAAVALIDARGALDDGLSATRRLGGLVATNGAALLVLVSRGDVE